MSTPRPQIVVMKFGGTSVEDATAMLRTASIVEGRIRKGLRPVVVVSAMAKVTDALLAAAAAAGKNERDEALKISDGLRTRHLGVAAELASGDALTSLQLNVHHDFDALDEMLRGICAVGELTLRSTDNIVSFGERLSSRMVTAAFKHRGMDSAHVDARTVIITDDHYGKAAPDEAKIALALEAGVLPLVEDGKVPVMGGFIGSCNGITTTLGRGGSDYTAALVGGGLHGGAIEIWTDVNGIMTTDPRIVPEALRVKTISFEEAAELAYFGAKVLHPATILPAVQKNIPVWVLNSRNAENEGTVITATQPHCKSPFKSIAAKKRLTIIDIVASRMLLAHGFLKMVFDVFDKYGCAIDMVSTSEVSISVTVDSRESLPEICAELSKIADVKLEGSKALICLVGEDIRGHAGIAGQVFSAVEHVNLRMISQGASEINMSFMINEEDVEEAIRSLHKKFFSSPDPSIFDVEAAAAAKA
ncbi:lysine-sensitive aspartokinase 3 [Granulicella cerasi]|uniref:Aspartokinase n=1 Tax=Granulicella cerasi TaxID=741063 RepID=A0ABW1Z644_9BACT|nr:lysine-sensitive aspartokinase 3 [Granulicella cerasi]